jgi:hypothetical protein
VLKCQPAMSDVVRDLFSAANLPLFFRCNIVLLETQKLKLNIKIMQGLFML